MKKIISYFLCSVILFVLFNPLYAGAYDTNFSVYTTYSDIQAYEGSPDLRWGTNTNHIAWQQISTVYLARNEYEGFQVFFYEGGAGRNLSIKVDEFINGDGEILEHSVYNEAYIKPEGASDVHFADALIPYNGENIQTKANDNNMFYIELHSSKTQTPGNYSANVTLYDDGELINTKKMTAVVWNFSLPEGHYATTTAGLYDSSSGYSTTRGFLQLSGVRFENGEIIEEDKALAEEILEGWDDFLLEHGVSPYELPRFLIENDKNAAELAMADTRRAAFSVPLKESTVLKYKDIVYNNKFLSKKAYFYLTDEPNWSTESDYASFQALADRMNELWPGYHAVAPFYGTANYDLQINELKNTTDILCINQNTVAKNSNVFNEFKNGSWYRTWRYQGDSSLCGAYMYFWGKSVPGIFTRALYWQANDLNSNGILHWNCGYCPFKSDGTPYNVWDDMAIYKASPSTGNGDGIWVYPSAPLGLDPKTPIASLRLKHISNGMDDYDYLQLAKEFLGEDSEAYKSAVKTVFWAPGSQDIFSREMLQSPWECVTFNSARIALGKALSTANTTHSFGEWETAVECDETHNGLEIRICSDCGAEESRKILSLSKMLCKNNKVTVNPNGYIFGLPAYLNSITDYLKPAADYFKLSVDNGLIGTGAKIKVSDENGVGDVYTVIITGDLDGDSVCDVIDASLAEKAVNNKVTLSKEQICAANGCYSEEVDITAYQNVVNEALE